MIVQVIREAGHEEALMGMALSYKDRKIPINEWWTSEQFEKAHRRSKLLAHKQGGHNKFLESICVWLYVEASRDFWSEMDTYPVGTTKQSESTMHTLSKRPPEVGDFEDGVEEATFLAFLSAWEKHKSDVTTLKKNLPEGFLQARIICTNYKVLQNSLWQRDGHRLKQWCQFSYVIDQLEHPYYLKEKA